MRGERYFGGKKYNQAVTVSRPKYADSYLGGEKKEMHLSALGGFSRLWMRGL